MIATILVLGICVLRPNEDALDVVAQVLKGLAPTIAAVLAYLKSQETHLSVNGRLDAFMIAHGQASHAQGVIQGVAEEQARHAAEKVKIETAKIMAVAAAASASPTPAPAPASQPSQVPVILVQQPTTTATPIVVPQPVPIVAPLPVQPPTDETPKG
jgi:hypothetical protein